MANAKQKAILRYDPKSYELAALKSGSLTYDEQLKEYARLRNIANRRLEAFERNKEPHLRKTEAYRQNVGRYNLPATQLTERQLRANLADVAKFVSAKSSSVTGQRRIMNQEIEGLHLSGYTFVNKNNYWDFVDYMDEIKTRYHNRIIPDSDRIAELFGTAEKLKVKPRTLKRNFDNYKKHAEELKELTEEKNFDSLTSAQVKEKIKDILSTTSKKKKK